jgi:hypothetical protein
VLKQKKAEAEFARARKLDPALEQRMRHAAFDKSARRQVGIHPIIAGFRR